MTRYIQEYIPITEDMIVKPHEDDLIRRVDAINALHEYFKEGFDSDKWWNSTHVLCALNDEYITKTPQKILDKINSERDRDYLFFIDENIPLTEQNLSSEAIAMLAALKLDYWCKTKEEKEELEQLLKANDKGVKLSGNLKKTLFKNGQ